MNNEVSTARIVVFGDSIAYGAWDTVGGWVERLKARAHQATTASHGVKKFQVLNMGIGGNTSKSILARAEAEVIARHSSNWPFVFILSVGTNDQRLIDGVPEVPIEQYKQNMEAITTLLKGYSAECIVLGLPPLGVPELDFKGTIYSDARIEEYDSVLRSVAEARSLRYIDTRTQFASRPAQLFAYDQLHPNDEGHALICSLVNDELASMGIAL